MSLTTYLDSWLTFFMKITENWFNPKTGDSGNNIPIITIPMKLAYFIMAVVVLILIVIQIRHIYECIKEQRNTALMYRHEDTMNRRYPPNFCPIKKRRKTKGAKQRQLV